MDRKLTDVTNEHGKLEAYAWPGGYDIAYYAEDDGLLCAFCANAERDPDDPQWNIVTYDVTDSWDERETCEHCGRSIGPDTGPDAVDLESYRDTQRARTFGYNA